MKTEIIVALISLAGGIITTILGKISLTSLTSRSFRSKHSIPDIQGTSWSCEWLYENDDLYVKDDIKIVKWTKDGSFEGFGRQAKEGDPAAHVYEYPIKGEVFPTRVVVLTYQAEKYPTEGHVGMACMELNNDATKMDGHWCGMASKKLDEGNEESALRHGKVRCIKRA
jgi:hypothetical protein